MIVGVNWFFFFYSINFNIFLVGQNWSHRWVPHIIRDFLLTCERNLMLNFLPYSIFLNCTSVRLSCAFMSTILSGFWISTSLHFFWLCRYASENPRWPVGHKPSFLFLYFYYFFLKFLKQVFVQVYRYLQVDRWRGVLPFSVSIIAYLISM